MHWTAVIGPTNNRTTSEKKNDMSEVQKKAVLVNGDVTLTDVINGNSEPPLDLRAFQEHCKLRLSEENLNFVLMVQREFRKIQDSASFERMVVQIIDTFIKNDSPQQLNIPDKMQKTLISAHLAALKGSRVSFTIY